MKKTLISVAGFLLFTVLAGGGCNNPTPETTEPASKPAETATTQETPATTPTEETTTVNFKLTAEAKGYTAVQFNWEVPEDMAKRAVAYRILNSEEENPTWPTMYYFQRGPTYREKLWSNLPTGRQHFRVCAVENNECFAYTNDVGVDVK